MVKVRQHLKQVVPNDSRTIFWDEKKNESACNSADLNIDDVFPSVWTKKLPVLWLDVPLSDGFTRRNVTRLLYNHDVCKLCRNLVLLPWKLCLIWVDLWVDLGNWQIGVRIPCSLSRSNLSCSHYSSSTVAMHSTTTNTLLQTYCMASWECKFHKLIRYTPCPVRALVQPLRCPRSTPSQMVSLYKPSQLFQVRTKYQFTFAFFFGVDQNNLYIFDDQDGLYHPKQISQPGISTR